MLVWSDDQVFFYVDGQEHVCCLAGEVMAPGCTIATKEVGRSSGILWAMFCCETLHFGTFVDVTLTCTTNLSISADQIHPFHGNCIP